MGTVIWMEKIEKGRTARGKEKAKAKTK